MALAYTIPVEDFESALRGRGISDDYFINFVKTLNNEQSKDSLLGKARYRGGRTSVLSETESAVSPEGSRTPQEPAGEVRGEDGRRPVQVQRDDTGEGSISAVKGDVTKTPTPQPIKETPKPKTSKPKTKDIVAERKAKVDKKFTLYNYALDPKEFDFR